MAVNVNYCLRLNEFEDIVKIYWQELQMENYFCDVTLACVIKSYFRYPIFIIPDINDTQYI